MVPDQTTFQAPRLSQQREDPFARIGGGLADWAEKWFPDAFVFALIAALIVAIGALLLGSSVSDVVKYFGGGFWELIPFTMQMVMIIVGGYVVATAPPVYRLITFLARIPRSPRSAVAFVALISSITSLLSYGFSLIFAGFLAREIARRMSTVDYRALGAAAYIGLGSIWALGLSSSAALLMATKASIPNSLLNISGVIAFNQTIFSWQSIIMAAVLLIVSVSVAYFSAPAGSALRTAASLGVKLEPLTTPKDERPKTPAEWLEHLPVLTIGICVLGFSYVIQVLKTKGPVAALDLNLYNFSFLLLGLLLHWRPRSFTRSVVQSAPATAGVLIQFPFYAGIFGIISSSAIANTLAGFFSTVSSRGTYPLVVAVYSAGLGMLVPSGGGKWLIEAPYVLTAANHLHVNLGWTVQIYNAAEALPNLINPFWMLPLLGILKLKARDLIGFSLLQLVIHVPVVLFLLWFFSRLTPYSPPIVP